MWITKRNWTWIHRIGKRQFTARVTYIAQEWTITYRSFWIILDSHHMDICFLYTYHFQCGLTRTIELQIFRWREEKIRMKQYTAREWTIIYRSFWITLDYHHFMDWIGSTCMDWIQVLRERYKDLTAYCYEDGVRNEAMFQRILQSDKYYSDILPHRRFTRKKTS
jgi:hypothetical protein